MKTHIFVEAIQEPEGLHGEDDIWAVHLAVEVESENMEDQKAREQVQKILRAFAYPALKFQWRNKDLAEVGETVNPRRDVEQGVAESYIKWLVKRGYSFGGPLEVANVNEDREIDAASAKAGVHILSTANWIAPMGQRLGVSMLVPRNAATGTNLRPVGVDLDVENVVFHGKCIERVDVDQFGLNANLFLKLYEDSEARHALLQAAEAHAGEFFDVLPALLKAAAGADGLSIENEFKWLRDEGVRAAFEPIRRSLMMWPGDGDPGPLLRLLVDDEWNAKGRPDIGEYIWCKNRAEEIQNALEDFNEHEKWLEFVAPDAHKSLPSDGADRTDDSWKRLITALSQAATELQKEAGKRAALIWLFEELIKPEIISSELKEVLSEEFVAESISEALGACLYRVLSDKNLSFLDMGAELRNQSPLSRLQNAPPSGHLGNRISTIREEAVQRILDDAKRRQLSGSNGVQRFTPDKSPAPLPVAIVGQGQQEWDQWATAFNGVGVLIRRIDSEKPPWQHACLAKLRYSKGGEKQDVAPVLRPHNAAMVNGMRALYLEYHGFPFVSAPASPEGLQAADQADGLGGGFYTVSPTEMAATPALCYGRRFEWCAFAVTRAGTLPNSLQENGERPWLPKTSDIQLPEMAANISKADYSRRTMIAGMVFADVGRPSIGHVPEDVYPLSNDYPRTVLFADSGQMAFVDLLRNADGEGGCWLDESTPTDMIVLSDIRVSGSSKPDLRVEVLYSANAKARYDEVDALNVVRNADRKEVSISLGGPEEGNTDQDATSVLAHKGKRFWVRLWIKAGDQATGVSFASIHGAGRPRVTSAPEQAPLLLLRSEDDGWDKGLVQSQAELQVTTPRVSFSDLERWLRNDDELFRLFGAHNEGEAKKKAKNFREALDFIYALFGADPDVASVLNNLPDPAVRKLLVDAPVADAILKETSSKGDLEARIVAINPYDLGERENGLVEKIVDETSSFERLRDDALELLGILGSKGVYHLTVNCDNEEGSKLTDGELTVSPGVTRQLRVRPLVEERLFDRASGDYPPVIANGLRQLEVGRYRVGDTAYAIFGGAILCVEAMKDELRDTNNEAPKTIAPKKIGGKLCETGIRIESAGTDRRYRVVAGPSKGLHKEWRSISHISVHTQRWRPSGQGGPYARISPRKHAVKDAPRDQAKDAPRDQAKDAPRDQATLEIRVDEKVLEFERDLFFDRSDEEAESRTIRLDPLPGTTTLREQSWEQPTATYERHRFTFFNRYRGAMKGGVKHIASWDENEESTWNRRVAILAAPGRIALTRPQIRAFETATIALGAPGDAPPILARVEEAPFSQGGLAEAIVAELAVSVGHGFVKDRVMPTELRREIGRDPRLGYKPMETQGLVLLAEGPLGTHYDSPSTASPKYVNSVYLLRPASWKPNHERIEEETMLSTSLRRVLLPEWSVQSGGKMEKGEPLDIESTWWISLSAKIDMQARLGKDEVFRVSEVGRQCSVEIERRWLDPTAEVEYLTLCRLAKDEIGEMVLIHMPLGEGRYLLSVLAKSKSGEKGGNWGNAVPTPAGSIVWTRGRIESAGEAAKFCIDGDNGDAMPLRASEGTEAQWVKSGRDFDAIRLAKESGNGDDGRRFDIFRAEELIAKYTPENGLQLGKTMDKLRTPIPSVGASADPLHVQRRLAVIALRRSQGIGRKFDEVLGIGDLWKTEGIEKADRIRLMEYEVPAVIIGWKNEGALPERYLMPRVNLGATGGVGRSLHIHLRPAVDSSAFKGVLLIVRLFSAVNGNSEKQIRIDFPLPKHVTSFLGCDIWININRETGEVYGTVLGCGEKGAGTRVKPVVLDPIGDASELTLQLVRGGDAKDTIWADVSVCWSEGRNVPRFDLDWLFSHGIADAKLQEMNEVQARVVSVSPEIALKWDEQTKK